MPPPHAGLGDIADCVAIEPHVWLHLQNVVDFKLLPDEETNS